jgi:hypothetical protein
MQIIKNSFLVMVFMMFSQLMSCFISLLKSNVKQRKGYCYLLRYKQTVCHIFSYLKSIGYIIKCFLRKKEISKNEIFTVFINWQRLILIAITLWLKGQRKRFFSGLYDKNRVNCKLSLYDKKSNFMTKILNNIGYIIFK